MTAVTVNHVDADQDNDKGPPSGTAIVRPLRHVRAVRQRHAIRYADPAELATSRSARAWAWALGENATSPVTDRRTAIPPSRPDIGAEIVAADERRLRGDRENRADAAATILRWLIGRNDHVPVRCDNPGELVGGFGEVVRSRQQIADALAIAVNGQRCASAQAQGLNMDLGSRSAERQQEAYFDGVTATLAWVLGKRGESPIAGAYSASVSGRDLKAERVRAEDVTDQVRYPWLADQLPTPWYGEGVKSSIAWLLGDQTASPINPVRCPRG
jgi:hypothetical protein